MKSEVKVGDNRLQITRIFNAPRPLVFAFWKDPERDVYKRQALYRAKANGRNRSELGVLPGSEDSGSDLVGNCAAKS